MTLPLWVHLVTVIFIGYGLYVLSFHLYRSLLSKTGAWKDKPCPVCLRMRADSRNDKDHES